MFTKKYLWTMVGFFVFGCFVPSFFTERIWIYLLSGIIIGYYFSINIVISEEIIKKNQEFLHETVKDIVEGKKYNFPDF